MRSLLLLRAVHLGLVVLVLRWNSPCCESSQHYDKFEGALTTLYLPREEQHKIIATPRPAPSWNRCTQEGIPRPQGRSPDCIGHILPDSVRRGFAQIIKEMSVVQVETHCFGQASDLTSLRPARSSFLRCRIFVSSSHEMSCLIAMSSFSPGKNKYGWINWAGTPPQRARMACFVTAHHVSHNRTAFCSPNPQPSNLSASLATSGGRILKRHTKFCNSGLQRFRIPCAFAPCAFFSWAFGHFTFLATRSAGLCASDRGVPSRATASKLMDKIHSFSRITSFYCVLGE